MTKLQKEIVGRSAIGVIGVALLLGGWKTLSTAMAISADGRARAAADGVDSRSSPGTRRTIGGPVLFYVVGIALVLAGGVVALAAVLPSDALGRLLGPPKMTLGDNGGSDDDEGIWSRWWWR